MPGRPSGPHAAALALATLAILIPPTSLAEAATDTAGAWRASLVTGAWILKGVLALLAAWVAGTDWWLRKGGSRAPLVGSGLASETRTPGYLAALVGLLVVALGLRLVALGSGLWFDEIQTLVEYARLPVGQVVTTFDSQNNHVLYSVVASITLSVLGESAWGLRLPAVLFGVASLWALDVFGRLVTSRRETLLAVALAAASFHHVWFSQNARGYTALMFLTLLGSWYFLRLLSQPPSWRIILGYGLVMSLATYTHVTAALTVVGHGLVWVILAWRTRSAEWQAPLAALAFAALGSALLYALVLPQFVDTVFSSAHGGRTTDWQSPVWLVAETLRGLARGVPGGWVGVLGGLVVAGAGTWSYWRQSRPVLALMVLPPALMAAAAIALSHNLWPRFFFFAAGFALLIIMRGLVTLWALVVPRPVPLATATATVMILGSLWTVPRAWQPKQDFEGATAFVEGERTAEDAVVTVDLTTYPVREYLQRPWQVAADGAALAAIEAVHPRTWVLFTFPVRLQAIFPEVYRRLTSGYDTAAVFPGSVGGGTIYVMVRQ